jgi:hypothetical protein
MPNTRNLISDENNMVSRVIVNKLQENFIENAAAVFVANIFLC